MYDTGAGMAQNQTEAVRWYRAAAQQGLAIAQLNLGVDYSTGQGVLKNDAEAIKWFRLAANQGEPQAQFNLGLMYAKGQGVAQNFVEAYRWAKLAADQGHDVARSLAHDLSEKMAQDRTAKPVDATPVSQAKVSANTVTPEKIAIYVQIGAFKSEKLAEKFRVLLISKLGDVGKPLGLYTEDDLVRIQVGPYDSASDARAAARSLKIRIGIEPMLKTR
jgi:TPR repeat protein